MPAGGARRRLSRLSALGLLAGLLLLAGCHRDMRDQPKFKPFRSSGFFDDDRSARTPVPGTVARGQLHADTLLYRGTVGGKPSPIFPFPVTEEVLRRGQERYNIFCSPCHDRAGTGRGMIVQRGFRQPPSFHIDRLRAAPPGYVFGVITNGFGVMYDYSAQIKPEDRWAIVAYVKALQMSQRSRLGDLEPADRDSLLRLAPRSGRAERGGGR